MKSNLKKILDSEPDPGRSIDRLVTYTKIARRLLVGYYTGKFKPNIQDALKIARSLELRVEQIWQL